MRGAIDAAKSASDKDAKSPVGTCPLKESLVGIVPVRYAFDDNDEHSHQLHPFPENDKQWKGRFSSKNRNYTLRQLRDGWLYVYDDTDKTFHEYQVEGAQLIKIDWSDDEANKSITERGTKGKVQSHLLYPANNILYIAFAHQRWTWRLCEHVRSRHDSRTVWMRKINLKAIDCDNTSLHPHAHFANYLGDYVADIDAQDNKRFMDTCTPLVDPEQEGGTPENDLFKQVASKSIAASTTYLKDIPEKNGIFVALDDPLADISDLFLPLAEQVVLRSTLSGDEDDIHKLQMAELTRTLGRVRLEYEELPPQIKDDPIKVLEFERQLSEYLATQYLADRERIALDSNLNVSSAPFTLLQEEALRKLTELNESYQFTPTDEQQKRWQRNTVFSDEVNWKELDTFLIQYYEQIEGLDERIDALYQDFMTAYEKLGTDPIVLGLDNQDETHLSYLLSLTNQYLAVVKQAVNTEQAHEELKQKLSLDSPQTLMSLASLGFSVENVQALNEHLEDLKSSLLSLDNSSDMVAVSGAIANWGGFSGDSRVQEKIWFKALAEPVQLSFTALQKAVSGKAYDNWRAISNFLFPSQMITTATPEGLVSNLRLIILETLVNPEAIVVYNPDYAKHVEDWQKKLRTEAEITRRVNRMLSGEVTPVNYELQNMQSAQKKIQKILSSELPMMVMLKNEAVNNAAKQMFNDAIERSWQYGKQMTQASWGKLGRMGGVVAILNLWNVSIALKDIRHKAALHPNNDFWADPAVREAIYATGYAVSAVTSIWRDAAWEKIAKDEALLKKSLSIAIKEESLAKSGTLKTFAKTTAVVSLFGLIATGLETWESSEKAWDSSNSPMERVGYGLKGLSTGAQFLVFLAQFAFNSTSRLGAASIGAIIAPWMLTTLTVAGFVYLISIIINVFKRSELEKWLLHSTWGNEPKMWNPTGELTRLERIIHKPQVRLNKVCSNAPAKARYHAAVGQQWQLELDLPAFIIGQSIGLQITRKPIDNTYSYSTTKEKPSVILNEQNGTWSQDNEKGGAVIYRLNLGGTTEDTITVLVTMPFNWQASKVEQLGYVASGSRQGDLFVAPAQKEFATRIMEVRLD